MSARLPNDQEGAWYEARHWLLRHDSAFYGPLKGARCGCQECKLIRALVGELDTLAAAVSPVALPARTDEGQA